MRAEISYDEQFHATIPDVTTLWRLKKVSIRQKANPPDQGNLLFTRMNSQLLRKLKVTAVEARNNQAIRDALKQEKRDLQGQVERQSKLRKLNEAVAR